MRARTLSITWTKGRKVTGRLLAPPSAAPIGVLLAHGAGAGQQHPFNVTMRNGLAAAGFTVLSFDYAYTAEGRKAPDRMERLLQVHQAVANRLATRCDAVAFVGKSMGGRVGAHLVGDLGWPASAAVYLGYPLVPRGGEPRATDHLERIGVPQLFVAGAKDPVSPPGLIEPLARTLPTADTYIVSAGDHSLKVPKRGGRDPDAVLRSVAATVAAWLSSVTPVPVGTGPG